MITKDLSEAAVEVNVILERAPENYIRNIPEAFKNFLKEIESKTYIFNYDESKSLNEQNLKKETRGLIGLIYRDYICNGEQKNEYISKIDNYMKQQELEKREKYNPDKIFKNKKENTISNEEIINEEIVNESTTDMIPYEENLFKRIWTKIISIFKF